MGTVAVAAMATATATDGPDRGALDAYRRLGVAWLVDGTLQRVGERLRITTRVVEVSTGAIAFSTRVDGDLGDLFDLQDEVGAALAGRLSTASGNPTGAAAGMATRADFEPAAPTAFGPSAVVAAPPPLVVPVAPDPEPEQNVTGALAFGGPGGRRRRADPAPSPAPRWSQGRRRVHADAANPPHDGHRADQHAAGDRRPARRLGLGDRHPTSRTSSRSRRWRVRPERRRPRCGWRTTATISTSPSTPTTPGPR